MYYLFVSYYIPDLSLEHAVSIESCLYSKISALGFRANNLARNMLMLLVMVKLSLVCLKNLWWQHSKQSCMVRVAIAKRIGYTDMGLVKN